MSILMEEDHRSQLADGSQLVIEQLSDFDGPSEFLTELEDLEYERSYPGSEADSRYFGRNEEDEFALGWPEDQMEVNDTGVDHHDKPWSPLPLDSEDEARFGDEELQCEHEHLRGTTPPNSNLTRLQEAFGGIQHTEAVINMSIDEAFDIDLDFGPPEDNGVDFEALDSCSSSPAVQRPHPRPTQSHQQGAPTEQQKAGPTEEPPHDDQGDTAGYDEDRGVIHDGPVDHDEEADKQAGDEASRKPKNKRKARVLKENHDNPSLVGYYSMLCTAMLEMAKGYFWQHVVELCTVAQGHIASEYDLRALSSAKTKGEWIKAVKDKAEKLAKGFLFLRGENDSNEKTLNFAHPGLRAICIAAFYHSGSKSFRNHPEFKAALPYLAMLLVPSLLDNMLEQWAEDGMTGFELDEGAGEDEECKIVLN
ncbi:hypothetical protein PAXINDRAFT_20719 [Paxillus involutus ATCC 200175]|uniref:Unplaced genomic scaffold PAXINscaffold_1212, whole genome shotgun sequence n=1 Tax=Paxillus involutus ATCC 200175 TaxID=664439 RepID=A0A0C9SUF5_PAXIN|nr:hypothetical protein PAXINDRAFT_20719 [Paxillus involutus ATCC 200175]